jgi:hypothetical protein
MKPKSEDSERDADGASPALTSAPRNLLRIGLIEP